MTLKAEVSYGQAATVPYVLAAACHRLCTAVACIQPSKPAAPTSLLTHFTLPALQQPVAHQPHRQLQPSFEQRHNSSHGSPALHKLFPLCGHHDARAGLLQLLRSTLLAHIWLHSRTAHQQLPASGHDPASYTVCCVSSQRLSWWPQVGLLLGCLLSAAWHQHFMPAHSGGGAVHRLSGRC